jgi:cold shock protein
MNGTVKFYNSERGFGFLTPSDGTEEVFVHHSSIEGRVDLCQGDKVEFTVEPSRKPGKLEAKGVKVLP